MWGERGRKEVKIDGVVKGGSLEKERGGRIDMVLRIRDEEKVLKRKIERKWIDCSIGNRVGMWKNIMCFSGEMEGWSDCEIVGGICKILSVVGLYFCEYFFFVKLFCFFCMGVDLNGIYFIVFYKFMLRCIGVFMGFIEGNIV